MHSWSYLKIIGILGDFIEDFGMTESFYSTAMLHLLDSNKTLGKNFRPNSCCSNWILSLQNALEWSNKRTVTILAEFVNLNDLENELNGYLDGVA
jgi:hypothetical protein